MISLLLDILLSLKEEDSCHVYAAIASKVVSVGSVSQTGLTAADLHKLTRAVCALKYSIKLGVILPAISIRRDISDSKSVFSENLGTVQVYDLFTKLVGHSNFLKNTMIGKIRHKLIALAPIHHLKVMDVMCPICDRSIPELQKDAHHLVPKSKGGKRTEYLHRICHRQIHALFTETELAIQFNTAAALQDHPEMQRFIKWIKKKPIHFYQKSHKSSRLKEN